MAPKATTKKVTKKPMPKKANKVNSTPLKVGDVVYITMAGQDFIARNKPDFSVNIAGRLARIHDIYDWKTPRGKSLLAERAKSPKWVNLKSEDYKYVLVIYYPDLKKDDVLGISIAELFPEHHPLQEEPKIPLFRKWDESLLMDAFSASSDLHLTASSN